MIKSEYYGPLLEYIFLFARCKLFLQQFLDLQMEALGHKVIKFSDSLLEIDNFMGSFFRSHLSSQIRTNAMQQENPMVNFLHQLRSIRIYQGGRNV